MVLSPIFVLVAVLIKLDSRGPVLYKQERVGRGGERFVFLKFRSMVTDADKQSRLTTEGDARVTRVGRVLRKTNLDELPQLVNVLRGDMSLVGPRPDVPEFVDLDDERWRDVLSVRPGMTSPETIAYRQEDAVLARYDDPEEAYREEILPAKLERARRYVQERTFWGDIGIILATFTDIATGSRSDPDRSREGKEGRRFFSLRVTPARRLAFFITVDVLILTFAVLAAFYLRFEGFWGPGMVKEIAFLSSFLVAGAVGTMLILGVYKVSWRYVGLRDVAVVALGVGVATATIGVITLLWHGESTLTRYPRSVVVMQAPLAFLGLAGFRLSKRAYVLMRKKKRHEASGVSTLLIGAGQAGEQVLSSLLETRKRGEYNVVGFLDDDPLAHGTRIHGVEVLGPVEEMEAYIRRYRVEAVVVCIATATGGFLREVLTRAREAGVETVRTVPTVSHLVDREATFQGTREIGMEDLLGRDPVEIDTEDLGAFIEGRTVVVTGGAGTIGSELCRQIARFSPAELLAVDIDESRLYELERELGEGHPGLRFTPVLVDVRDRETVERLCTDKRPEIVFHAAAYKHVPMLETWPERALEVNVLGTRNVVEAAEAAGCEHFVLISTDKAVEPANMMGASKRMAELLLFADGEGEGPGSGLDSGPRMTRSAVRFGNVLGSRGSVIPIFERQLADGGPLTVTHRDVERYFMMTSEAVSLVLQAAAMSAATRRASADRADGEPGRSDALYMLDMGQPVRILDVAEELVRLKGLEPDVDIPIVFTGLRPGEKLTERLTYPDEEQVETEHDRIHRLCVDAEAIDREALISTVEAGLEARDADEARTVVSKLLGTMDAPGSSNSLDSSESSTTSEADDRAKQPEPSADNA